MLLLLAYREKLSDQLEWRRGKCDTRNPSIPRPGNIPELNDTRIPGMIQGIVPGILKLSGTTIRRLKVVLRDCDFQDSEDSGPKVATVPAAATVLLKEDSPLPLKPPHP